MNEQRPNQALTFLAGISIGASLMYFLDPDRGTRRRHIVRDKAGSTMRSGGEALRDVALDVRNRAFGTAAEVRGRLQEEPVSDEQLVARVRSELGHHVESVRPIEVTAEHGVVTLRGQVLATELDAAVSTAAKVRGVNRVENELQVRTAEGEALAL